MKGLTHFVSGVAAATFIPQVVRMSAAGRLDIPGAASSFIIVLAGMYGIMPDTLDFKVGQFFDEPDIVVDPDPLNPNPKEMAQKFAEAVSRSAQEGRMIKIQYMPIQLGANRWRQYLIIFGEKEVSVQINEVVSTSQIPYPGTSPDPEKRSATVTLSHRIKPTSCDTDWLNKLVRKIRKTIKGGEKKKKTVKPSTIDILSGTTFGLKMESDGDIYFDWLPWHRTWSHSYILGLMLAAPWALIAYLLKLDMWWMYGLVAFLGFAVHITEDMTGHIGGSLLWPILKPRTEGFEMFKASDPRTNFSIIYAGFILIVFNLDRFTSNLLTGGPESFWSWWFFLLVFLVLPLAVYFKIIARISDGIKKREAGLKFTREEEEPDGTGDPVID